MKKYIIISFILFIVCSCSKKENTENFLYFDSLADTLFYFPAEFENQKAIWMSWSKYENKKGYDVKAVQAAIIARLSQDIEAYLLASPGETNSNEVDSVVQREIYDYMQKYGANLNNVKIIPVEYEDIWMRDMGPTFVLNKKGGKAIIDFGFNVWGYENQNSRLSQIEGSVDRKIAGKLKIPCISSFLIGEGGAREFNGKGTLILVESVEFHRNPGFSKEQIEAEYKRIFNLKKIIWLPFGMYDDELSFKKRLPGPDGKLNAYTVITTGGHVDQFVRFAGPRKILYSYCSEEETAKDPILRENKRRMDVVLNILKNETDQDGYPFELIPMPFAPTIYDTMYPGDGVYEYLASNDSVRVFNPFKYGEPIVVVLATGYLNFLISNRVIINAKYWREGDPLSWKELDEKAANVLRSAFPDKEIYLIDVRAINLGGGGIHCITQQEPQIKSK